MKYLKCNKKAILVLLCTCLLIHAQAQKEANIWHFGRFAGLDFNTGIPIALPGSLINTNEGCATMSDANGNLLFYTDGITVRDKNHGVMSNGTGLNGDASSTQSAIIIPRPGSSSVYYIFTVDFQGDPDGLQYSEVNMNMSGGLGSVTSNKNMPLATPVCEKVTAVRHSNGTDIWVITHGWNNNTFFAYLVSTSGVNPTPITSNIGTSISGPTNHTIGYLKASPDGQHLAIAHMYYNEAQLFDFNATTGAVSNPITLGNLYNGNGPHAVEFSPSSELLYIGETEITGSNIYQYEVNAASVPVSEKIIGTTVDLPCGAMQMGPDGKIYVAMKDRAYVGVINDPDSVGATADFVQNAVSLGSDTCRFGLPTFLPAIFNCKNSPEVNLGEDVPLCYGDSIWLNAAEKNALYLWHNGNTDSTFLSFSSGTFWVQRTINGCKSTDSILVQFDSVPYFDLGQDTIFCPNNSPQLIINLPNATFRWQNGDTNASIDVDQSGEYWAIASRNACSHSDTINIELDGCELFIPNIITPNEDGTNEAFTIKNLPEDFNLRVYNRWGNLVFEKGNYANNWKAEGLNDGIYLYILEHFISGEQHKGWVQVLR